jgi:FkbM family methyltransferase
VTGPAAETLFREEPHAHLSGLRRLRALRKRYARRDDWALSLYHRLLQRLPGVPLPGRGTLRAVRLSEPDASLYARLGSTDWYVLEEVFFDRIYEPAAALVPPDARLVVDLGANAGYSLRLWQERFPSARVVGVEPDAENLAMCRRNARGERLELVQACVVGTPRPVRLDRSEGAWAYRMTDAGGIAAGAPESSIEGLTLPQVLRLVRAAGPVDLLKCNIEGAEAEVFAKCGAWIGEVRVLAVQVHLPYDRARLLDDLARAGSDLRLYHAVRCRRDAEMLFLRQPAG